MRPLIARRVSPKRDHRTAIGAQQRAARAAHLAKPGAILDAARPRNAVVAELDIDALALEWFEHCACSARADGRRSTISIKKRRTGTLLPINVFGQRASAINIGKLRIEGTEVPYSAGTASDSSFLRGAAPPQRSGLCCAGAKGARSTSSPASISRAAVFAVIVQERRIAEAWRRRPWRSNRARKADHAIHRQQRRI